MTKFDQVYPCGCGKGHMCPTAQALWKDLLSWFLAPSDPGFIDAKQNWDNHFRVEQAEHEPVSVP